jgi:hypothetical protein
MIRRLELKNFKRFRSEAFEFLPNGVTLIAGVNNSGKSSVLHALTLWEHCRRLMEIKHGRAALESAGIGCVCHIRFKEFTPLMVPNFQHLWTNLAPTTGGASTPIMLKVIWFDREAPNAERELEFTLDLPSYLRVKTTSSTVPVGGPIPRMAYLPPFAGIQIKEPKLDFAARDRLLGQGLSGAVLRNHLCDLKRKSRAAYDALRDLRGKVSKSDLSKFKRTDAWEQFVTVLNEEFKCMVYTVEQGPDPNGHIILKASLTKGEFVDGKFTRFLKYKPRDLIVEGSGFLQWLSVFALASDRELDVLLLDEADVHLHPMLQARLLFRLNREAVDKSKQVLYVTHSTEILRKADYRNIYYVAERSKGYLGEESGKVRVIEGLGSLYVPRIEKLRQYKRVLIIEGSSDLSLLKIWTSTLGLVWPNNLVEWFSTGKPSERKTLFEELKKEVDGLHALSLRDRDDEPPETTAANLSDRNNPDPAIGPGQTYKILHRKWRRRHIENYLILPSAIARATIAKRTPYTEREVIDFLGQMHSTIINDTFTATDCASAIQDARAKEITYSGPNNTETKFGVTRFDIAKAMTHEEICDDVKNLIGQIVFFCQ